jgi:hypothetical protein
VGVMVVTKMWGEQEVEETPRLELSQSYSGALVVLYQGEETPP